MVQSKMKSFIKEFKEFINRGNVIDLAVAVVMGSSFTAIVNSIVNDIVMPLIGVIIGGINFNNLTITLKDATIYYGKFIQNVINFIVIAFVIFLTLKVINRAFNKKEKAKTVTPPPKSSEVLLLEEIRDLLKKEKKSS